MEFAADILYEYEFQCYPGSATVNHTQIVEDRLHLKFVIEKTVESAKISSERTTSRIDGSEFLLCLIMRHFQAKPL